LAGDGLRRETASTPLAGISEDIAATWRKSCRSDVQTVSAPSPDWWAGIDVTDGVADDSPEHAQPPWVGPVRLICESDARGRAAAGW